MQNQCKGLGTNGREGAEPHEVAIVVNVWMEIRRDWGVKWNSYQDMHAWVQNQ